MRMAFSDMATVQGKGGDVIEPLPKLAQNLALGAGIFRGEREAGRGLMRAAGQPMNRLGELHLAIFALPIIDPLCLTAGCYGDDPLKDGSGVYFRVAEPRECYASFLLGRPTAKAVGVLGATGGFHQ